MPIIKKKMTPRQKWRLNKWIVLVGLPGSGKSTLGSNAAKELGVDFFDADQEIVVAANMSIADIFETFGEAEFRRLEEKIIQRILLGSPAILALGGGAFENAKTRDNVNQHALSIWLDVEHQIILDRVGNKSGRPLFDQADNPALVLQQLAEKREKNFATADIRLVPQAQQSLFAASQELAQTIRKKTALRKLHYDQTHRSSK